MLARNLLRTRCRFLTQSYASSSKSDINETSLAKPRMQFQDLSSKVVPVEKLSLSRGLSMNKFEKDFFIFPEYADTDDVRNIQGFTSVLRKSLSDVLDPKSIEKDCSLSSELKLALEKNGILSTFIPSEFGGLGMCNKDIARMYEELGVDLNISSMVNVAHVASQLLILYGSEEQKQKYLPQIASGKLRPSLFQADNKSVRFGEVCGLSAEKLLTVKDIPMIGAADSNLAFVFVSSPGSLVQDSISSSICYIVERSALANTDTWIFKRKDSLGLKALEIGDLSITTTVNSQNLLGEESQGNEILGELSCSGNTSLAAAVVGHTKKLLAELSALCNRTPSRNGNNTVMSADTGPQRIVTAVALKLYALESVLYYVDGLLDEGHPFVADIENAIIKNLSRGLLKECVSATIELSGFYSADSSLSFEKNIRDISTLLSLTGQGTETESIAMATLSSWTSGSGNIVTSTIKRLLGNERSNSNMKNPKLQHYIAEHAHPSLQLACQELEFSISRLNTVINKMVTEQGKNIEQDFGSLERLVSVIENHLTMVAIIARASRSYAVGLRNADIELAWATTICTRLGRANWFELEAMSDYFGLVRFNPSILNCGRAVFDMSGYCIESPVERNW